MNLCNLAFLFLSRLLIQIWNSIQAQLIQSQKQFTEIKNKLTNKYD
jgi:hypothetical protein